MVSSLSVIYFLTMKNLFLILILCFIYSCQHDNKDYEKIKLINNKKHSFDTGFKNYIAPRTYVFNNELFVVYSDFVTFKKLVLHKYNSTEKIEIPVNEIIDKNEKILSFDILNLDSILILTGYTNHLYLINKLGEIQKMIDFNPFLNKFYNPKYSFEMSGVSESFMINDTTLIVSLSPYFDVEKFEMVSYYETIYKDSIPYLFKVDNIFSDSISSSFGLYNFYDRFSDKEDFVGELKTICFSNDNIVVKTHYSDTIYFIDKYSLQIKNMVKISSKYIDKPIKAPPLSLKQMKMGVDHNQHIASFPKISSDIFFDGKYYLFGLSDPSGINTLMFLDTNLEIIDEILFDSYAFNDFYGLSKNNSLLINDNKLYKDSSKYFKINTFTSFNYDTK